MVEAAAAAAVRTGDRARIHLYLLFNRLGLIIEGVGHHPAELIQ